MAVSILKITELKVIFSYNYLSTAPKKQFLEKLSPNSRAYVEILPYKEGKLFEDLFPDTDFNEDTNGNSNTSTVIARDLLQKMLMIDPEERITVREALKHKFFADWYDENEANAVIFLF